MLRRTKIVATLGPATDKGGILARLIKSGVDMVRLNFSHGVAADHRRRAEQVREEAGRQGRHVAILGDLQGPKIRVGQFSEGRAQLEEGSDFTLAPDWPADGGNSRGVSVDYGKLADDCTRGDILLLDDGRLRLKVREIKGRTLHTRVVVGGWLSNNKGINKMGGGLTAPALTAKDRRDIETAAELKLDYLAVSFPRDAADVEKARKLLRDAGGEAHIVAKIERAEAVADEEHLDQLILASDVVMVARGDLAVEIGDAELMGVQKHLIKRSRHLNRVVITATQMMESMISSPVPTRAEVCDVANAVLDGSDAVMLSAETAAGDYPVETVKHMAEVIVGAEKHRTRQRPPRVMQENYPAGDACIAMAAMTIANHCRDIRAIICQTETGNTARLMSRVRSDIPIYAFCRHHSTCNRVALYRGVDPVHMEMEGLDGAERDQLAIADLKRRKLLKSGDFVLVSRGYHQDIGGSTDTLRIVEVE
ncbi:pyruvate kinase [Microbulbifer rhizosphaerae]|uniref:Pyruvate kinase n=1 Tax=Microbulbifer rhizosphaerae TaxID=1562603 RepID=A0A7W4WBI3_9GAMM|nr:pyruvate kinase [Microbulbifer rhizosphaerae]MBB3060638.1 pyruvate kinase [Microbulbifer rhizosphaerae]